MYELSRSRAVRPSPLFLTVLGVTALGGILAWTQRPLGSRLGDFGVFLFVLGAWIASVCLHEFAHAYAAYRAGDRGVETRGYLTLNPFKYTHPVLSILLPLVAIIGGGFALPGGAVYLHPHTFRSRAARSWAAAAGPLVNVVLAIGLVALVNHYFDAQHLRFWTAIGFLALLQVTAAVLNLLPIPGLDGYGIVEPHMDAETVRIGEKVKPWGLLAVIVLLFYVTPLKSAFFDLVDAIYRALGGDDTVPGIGYEFFKFWAKHPL